MAIPRYGVDKQRDALVSRYGRDSQVVRAYDIRKGYMRASDSNKPTPPYKADAGGKVTGYTPTKGDNPLETATTMPTGNFWDNANPVVKPGHRTPAQVTQIQKFLKNQGYNIGVDGVWGPQTQSAVNNWHTTRNSDIWNRSNHATPSTGTIDVKPTAPKPGPASPTHTAPPGAGSAVPTPKAPGAPKAPGGQPPSMIDQLMKMLGGVPNAQGIPVSLAGMGTGGIDESIIPDPTKDMIDPNQTKADLAAQYAPLIQEVQNQLGVVPYDTAQHLGDIRNWFNQIKDSVGQASADVGNIASQGQAQMGGDAGAIAASLGGSANAGASSIANEGQNQTDVIGQIGNIEQQYLGQMGPILSGQAQAAAFNETARQQGFAHDFQNKILEIQAQKAQDTNDKLLQIAQYNHGLQQERFQNLMGVKQYNQGLSAQKLQNILGILQYNQGAKQQNFSNRLAAAGFGLSANQLGLSAQDQASVIANRNLQGVLGVAAAKNAADANTRANVQTAFGISQAKRAAQIQQVQNSFKNNQAVQTATFNAGNAVGQAVQTLQPGQPWNGVIPKGMVKQAVGVAWNTLSGLPINQRKNAMRAVLLTFKNEKGQPLLTKAQIAAWGY